MLGVHDLMVEAIVVGDRLRPINEAAVCALMKSLSEVGMLHPILVSLDQGAPRLVSGSHRLEAARRLGWETVPCRLSNAATPDERLLVEIDENLARIDLSPAERAMHVTLRKAIYLRLHPESAHGSPTVSRQVGDLRPRKGEAERFTAVTAAAARVSERSVQREAARGAAIGAPALRALARTSLDKGEELDALVRLSEQQRAHLIARAAAGEKVSAKLEVKKDESQRLWHERERQYQHGGTVEDLVALGASGYRAGAILLDPPWKFSTWGPQGEGRSAVAHYQTESLDWIASLPVADLAAPNCALFVWVVDWIPPSQIEALLSRWGFTYKTKAFTWAKLNPSGEGWFMGTGYWTRSNPEDCWLATNGSPVRLNADVRKLIVESVREHSRKPDRIHDDIRRLVPGPHLELFARQPREGWLCWGNELPAPTPPTGATRGPTAPASGVMDSATTSRG